MNTEQLHSLIDAWRDDALTPEQAAALSQCLRESEDARREFHAEAQMHGLLHCAAMTSVVEQTGAVGAASVSRVRARMWLQWRPLVAAAAGIVLGMFCTSLLFARAGLSGMKTITLLDEGFDHAMVSQDNTAPLVPGVWRGTFSETTGGQAQVQPKNGAKMLRFLRGDYAGRTKNTNHHIADVYRLIDVRGLRDAGAGGDTTVEVSASFNAAAFPAEEAYKCAVTVYALDEENAPDSPSMVGTALISDSLAMARSSNARLDRDPGTWQRLDTELRLPPRTDFIVVRLQVAQAFNEAGRPVFTGTFADEVRVSLHVRGPVL